ncbi:4-hydroxy-tetrahydrodipicolinate synthase [Flavobacterium algicola]|uniref:4-hydroxy-tetrahydrodipicolinate synthase n=1 Tax=Flavobacterium algicola TaxID=556529 RepID=UPI001EFE2493|nr:4-hydroxy-tetrahydrodipicolinate synthase [Flavobacterium algicola]MCG9792600.1 4-hydroxy-tetrahydrodipicolinate synthase [Flavobacterium algicola]
MQALIGTGAALITPFKADLSIDTEALSQIVNFSVDGGVEYLVVLGTTAETATLSPAEKELVIDTIVATNDGRLPLVLGIGGNDTMKVVEELKTRDLSAFAAILSVSPFYNKPTQEGIYQHYKAVAEASPLPIIIYNVPGRTASNMLPVTVIRLANDCKNIVAVKEAAGDLVQAMEIIKNKPKDFLVISGDDMLALPMILAGGVGIITVIGQCFPTAFSEMVRLGLNRKVDEAYELHYRLADCIDMIFEQGNPAGIKQVFKVQGIAENYVRLPLVSVDESLANRIDSFVSEFDK